MENKYYTPTEKDFIHGLEYKWLNDELIGGKWMKGVYDVKRGLEENCERRVKRLDREDIGSLNWKPTGGENFNGGKTYFEEPNSDRMITLRPNFYKDGHASVHIYSVNSKGISHTFFAGKIKNKSELRELLEKLGIE